MIAVGEKVLELAGLMRQEASSVEPYNHGAANGLRIWADRLEGAVQAEAPEWLNIRDVRSWKGWSDRWLRRWAQGLIGTGDSRLTNRGWEVRWQRAHELSVKPAHLRAIRSDEDAEELGRQLGAEE